MEGSDRPAGVGRGGAAESQPPTSAAPTRLIGSPGSGYSSVLKSVNVIRALFARQASLGRALSPSISLPTSGRHQQSVTRLDFVFATATVLRQYRATVHYAALLCGHHHRGQDCGCARTGKFAFARFWHRPLPFTRHAVSGL